MKISTMAEAISYLQQYTAPSPRMFQAEYGRKRMEFFMQLLGNPQDQVKTIHVAGTSGKGSTCYFISHLLSMAGFTVGLTVSPHIRDIRERIQLNNEYISEENFCISLEKIIPTIEKMKDMEIGSPTYFEIMMGLAFFVFKEKNVDYAVIETGMGGQFDASNVTHSKNKVAVITRIGLDHTKVLGKTLSKIATQKARIIQKYNQVFSTYQRENVQKVIEQEAALKSAEVTFLGRNKSSKNIRIHDEKVYFDFQNSIKKLVLKSHATYQVENTTLALEVVLFLSKRDRFFFNEMIIRKALQTTEIPGRMEVFMTEKKSVVIDGAHNPQKMRTFLQSLKKLYPGKTFDFLVAFKRDKEVTAMIRMIIPYARKIIVTSFFVSDTMMNISAEPREIVAVIKAQGFENTESISDSTEAVKESIKRAKNILVITGSMYLIGEIYKDLTSLS